MRRALGVFLVVASLFSGRPVEAQVLPPVIGGVAGVAAGGWTTLGIFVARSRMGNLILDTGDLQSLRLELVPLITFPIAGALIGASSQARLRAVGAGVGIGAAAGALVGIGVGTMVSDAPEARWAGGIIGSAAGLVVGAVIGGLAPVNEPGPPEAGPPAGGDGASLSIRIPL
jgi:hypothetical protein